MGQITIFTAPKGFSDPHINIIQRNAIQSWKALGPRVEVLLIGDETGMGDTAAEFGVGHLPEVERNEFGTPLVNSIFDIARKYASSQTLIYLNADIILLPDCFTVIDAIQKRYRDYLLVGRRWDLNISWEIDFKTEWTTAIEDLMKKEGQLRSISAMDYFIFPVHLFQEIPPFAIGRAGWDNWMIYHAVHQPWPVIDITPSHRVIHQNHDYRHLPDGAAHYDLEESYHNVDLAGGMKSSYDLLDVPLVYREGLVQRKRINLPRVLRKLERLVIPAEQKGLRWIMTRFLRKLRRRIS